MLNLIRRAARLSAAEWRALGTAFVALARARIAYGRQPAQDLIRQLRARSDARPDHSAPPDDRTDRLRWALRSVSARVPWRADCLVQVLAAERILTRWGHAPKFHLGVETEHAGGFSAHVWLQLGDSVVTGGPVERLSVMIGEGAGG